MSVHVFSCILIWKPFFKKKKLEDHASKPLIGVANHASKPLIAATAPDISDAER